MEKYVVKSEFRCDSSDLAAERRQVNPGVAGVELRKEKAGIGSWERIRISTAEGAKSIGRPMGLYDTLTLPRMCDLDCDEVEDAKNEVAKGLCRICDATGITPEKILVVGLGNRELTPDAVGAMAAGTVRATSHIRDEDVHLFYSLECSEITVITPGVTAKSGLDAIEIVKVICDRNREGYLRQNTPGCGFCHRCPCSGGTLTPWHHGTDMRHGDMPGVGAWKSAW